MIRNTTLNDKKLFCYFTTDNIVYSLIPPPPAVKTRCSCEIPLVVSRIIKKYNLWNYIPAVKDISVLLVCQERWSVSDYS